MCFTGIVYVRTVGADTLTFGVSGDLWKDAMVMYDRETNSRWAHVTGRAITGPLTGSELAAYPATQTTWRAWVTAHPDTRVLKKPRLPRSYYALYDADSTRLGIHGRQLVRSALPAKSKVIAFRQVGKAFALPLASLAAGEMYQITAGGNQLLVAVDQAGMGVSIWRPLANADLPLTRLPGAVPTARTAGGELVSLTSGQTEAGRAVLERINSVSAYWFGWHNFYPETKIIQPKKAGSRL